MGVHQTSMPEHHPEAVLNLPLLLDADTFKQIRLLLFATAIKRILNR